MKDDSEAIKHAVIVLIINIISILIVLSLDKGSNGCSRSFDASTLIFLKIRPGSVERSIDL
jgi:hypothetical protein